MGPPRSRLCKARTPPPAMPPLSTTPTRSDSTSFKIQRSPDGSTGWTQVGTSGTTTFTDSGLIPSTTYFYRLLASDGPRISHSFPTRRSSDLAGLSYSQSPQGSWVGVYGVD